MALPTGWHWGRKSAVAKACSTAVPMEVPSVPMWAHLKVLPSVPMSVPMWAHVKVLPSVPMSVPMWAHLMALPSASWLGMELEASLVLEVEGLSAQGPAAS